MTHEDKRRYDSPLRDAQTAQTRARIVDAAAREFVRLGYAKTSMSAVAAVAGVSRETVYHLLGGKVAVLKAVYDVAVVGDHAETPVVDRDVYRAMLADPDPASAARTFGGCPPISSAGSGQSSRCCRTRPTSLSWPTCSLRPEPSACPAPATSWPALSGADPMTDRFAEAVDETYGLISPELALVLVEQRGWSLDSYGTWLGRRLAVVVADLRSVA